MEDGDSDLRKSIESFFFEDDFKSVVTVTLLSDESRNRDDVLFGVIDDSVVVDFANDELDGGSILGGEDSVGILTLAG